jgi:sugar O-acyltransferase (sialic acid O-acetyltransferase NeuD family)
MSAAGENFDLVIVGAGGFGRELHMWLPDLFPLHQYRFKGFLDRDAAGEVSSEKVLADPHDYSPSPDERFILAIGDLDARRAIAKSLVAKGAQFIHCIHPTAIVAPTAQIGPGAVVYPYAIVSHRARLGDFVHLSLYASVGHDAAVGNNCYLSPYATLNGESRIGDDVFLGSHATVGPGVRIGDQAKVAANSCALRDVPEASFVVGVPGVSVSQINTSSAE